MGDLIDLGSLIILLALSIFTLVATGNHKELMYSIRYLRGKTTNLDNNDISKIVESVEFTKKIILFYGLIIMTLSVIAIFINMMDVSLLGPYIARVVLTFLYMNVFELALSILANKLKRSIS